MPEHTQHGGGHDLVVVANRLPVDRREQPDGSVTWQPSPGGLVAALEPVMQRNTGAWIGWSGAAGEAPEPFDARGIRLIPVPLAQEDIAEFYEGMSNATLWPLYHDVVARPQFHRHWWEAYVRVNRRFAQASADHAADGALVWVQDYQLQLVPQLLRSMRPDLRIGFFNHIPFPPYEIFAQLPWRRAVLEGLLGADQLGFQRPADANNFLRACRRNGLQTRRGMVQLPPEPRFGSPQQHPRREVRAAAFPISIDAEKTDAMARRPDVIQRAKEIRAELGDPEVVLLGVDRLDYTKGILHRLKAVEELFEEGRLSSPDCVLVQVATPSRERVEEYLQLRHDVEVTVGRINGDHGRLGHPAVHYLHQAYDKLELAAMYRAADVLLVTALRDGMNLVAKEYVASRADERGALVLSEFAGAAIELPQAFLVNPHDIDGLKTAILRAVQVSPREAQRRMRAMRRRIFDHDVARWASTFLKVTGSAQPDDGTAGAAALHDGADLVEPPTEALAMEMFGTPGPAAPAAPNRRQGRARALAAARSAAADPGAGAHGARPAREVLPGELVTALEGFAMHPTLLVAFDFDGVLAPIVEHPSQARMLQQSHDGLNALVHLPGVRVALVSGRALDDLRRVAQPPPGIILVGSHGGEILDPISGAQANAVMDEQAQKLRDRVIRDLERISSQCPGTAVEIKPTTVVLHTRRAERPVAARAAADVLTGPATWDGIHLTEGKEVVELSVVDVTKGTALQALRRHTGADAVLYVGDDVTDERAFAVLDADASDVTVRVGTGQTLARHRLGSPADVASMLELLVELCRE